MSEQSWVMIVAGGLFFWNLILTVILTKVLRHYRRLVKKAGRGNLEKVLETILKEAKIGRENTEANRGNLAKLKEEGQKHLQHFGLVRFNPFSDSGGNQSFSLVILDDQESGIVITGLHGRDSTRIYTKKISRGKAVGGQLSKEEKLAVGQAKGGKKR